MNALNNFPNAVEIPKETLLSFTKDLRREGHDMPGGVFAEDFHPVHRPSHYNQHGIEAIQAIEASMTKEEFQGYLKGNCLKYLWRYRYKGKPQEDLEKARWYLDKLIESVGGSG